jgi:hypothetical protein
MPYYNHASGLDTYSSNQHKSPVVLLFAKNSPCIHIGLSPELKPLSNPSAMLLNSGICAHVLSGAGWPTFELNSLFNGLIVAPAFVEPVQRYTRNELSLPGVLQPPNMLSPAEKFIVGVALPEV